MPRALWGMMMVSKTCINCGIEFTQEKKETDKRFAVKRYCSRYCSHHLIHHEIIEKNCLECDAQLSKREDECYSKFLRRKYCNHNCYFNRTHKNSKGFKDITGLEHNGLKFLCYISDIKKWKILCPCGNEFVTKKGNVFSKSQPPTISCQQCGYKRISEHNKTLVGDKNPAWNPNLTDEDRQGKRDKFKIDNWKKSVYLKDNFRCKICNKGGKINAHHLDGWKWCIDRRFDINNGVTLCLKHHKEFHKLYGSGDNTAEEFFEYYLLTKPSGKNYAPT